MRALPLLLVLAVLAYFAVSLFYNWLSYRSWQLHQLRYRVSEWELLHPGEMPELPPHNTMLWMLWRHPDSFLPDDMKRLTDPDYRNS